MPYAAGCHAAACHYPFDTASSRFGAATPEFAQTISRKMVELPAAEAVRDLRENHPRAVTVDLVQRLTGLVGALAQSVIPVAGSGRTCGFTKAGHMLRLRAPVHSGSDRRGGLRGAILAS